MTPAQRVVDALEARGRVRRVSDGWMAQCPAHEDREPSLHVTEGDDGRVLLCCHANCLTGDVVAELGLSWSDLFAEGHSNRTEVATYNYTDERGKLLYQVVRYFPKTFRPRRPVSHGDGWEYNLTGTRRVPYNLPAVIEAVKAGKVVCVVDGEKDVHALRRKGVVGTCNPGGAGHWLPSFSEFLRGGRVAIIEDLDPPNEKGFRPGHEHAKQVRQSLEGVASEVKVFKPAKGKDVSDHLAAGLPLRALVPEGECRLQVMSARQIMALPTPDASGELLGPLLYRGHRVVLGAHTGNGKSTWTIQAVAAAVKGREFLGWKGRGEVRALVIDVEQGVRTVQRILREAAIHDSESVFYMRVPDGLALDSDPDAIADMEKALKNGRYDVVLADPLYKLHRGDPNDNRAAVELMRRFDEWRERFNFTLILPMHCRKPHPQSKLSPHDLFGASAYQWGAEVIMGLERKNNGYSHLHWWKDREGDLVPIGTRWGLMFDREHGFRRDPNDGERLPAYYRVRELLEKHGDGMRKKDICEELALSESTISKALKDLGCTRDDERLKAPEQRWLLPPSLLDGVGNGKGPGELTSEPGPTVSPMLNQEGPKSSAAA